MIPFLYRWLRNVSQSFAAIHSPHSTRTRWIQTEAKSISPWLGDDSEVRCAELVIVFPYPTNTRRNNFIKNRIKNNQEILSHLDGLKASL